MYKVSVGPKRYRAFRTFALATAHAQEIFEQTGTVVAIERMTPEDMKRRRNQHNRERFEALRSLGLKKTPYGWE